MRQFFKDLYWRFRLAYEGWKHQHQSSRMWNVPPSSPAVWYDDYDYETGDQINVDEDL